MGWGGGGREEGCSEGSGHDPGGRDHQCRDNNITIILQLRCNVVKNNATITAHCVIVEGSAVHTHLCVRACVRVAHARLRNAGGKFYIVFKFYKVFKW